MSAADPLGMVNLAAECKRAMCIEMAGPTDMFPTLIIEWLDGAIDIGLVSDRDAIPEAVALARELTGGTVATLAFVADAVVKTMPADECADDEYVRGELLAQRERGDMTIRDALVVTVIDAKGAITGAIQGYTYDDRGQPVFGAVEMEGGTMTGAVADALREAMRP